MLNEIWFKYFLVLATAPKASTLTAMEVWVVSCLVLVFFAIAEYGLLLHTKSRKGTHTCETSPMEPSDEQACVKVGKKKYKMPMLDKIAIVVLPLLFIVFNITYWLVYTT